MIYIKAKAKCDYCDEECDIELHVSQTDAITIRHIEYPDGWSVDNYGWAACHIHNRGNQ